MEQVATKHNSWEVAGVHSAVSPAISPERIHQISLHGHGTLGSHIVLLLYISSEGDAYSLPFSLHEVLHKCFGLYEMQS